MKRLERVVLVQFFLYDADEVAIGGHCAFLGPNGTGKTAIADAIQIAVVGAHGNYVKLNAQRDEGGRERTIREYCLGAIDGRFKREHAQTYITLVFRDSETGIEDSCGVALSAARDQPSHQLEGLYVVPGVGLHLKDHVEQTEDGDLPLRWQDFLHTLKAAAKAARTELVVGDRPEHYIGEMLMALGAGDRINRVDFLKAFKKSVLLRNIQTVDGFVRDFLIDARTINKQRAMEKIEHFKKLSALVAQVKAHIEELGGLGRRFDELQRLSRDAVAYDVAAVSLEHDILQERDGDLRDKDQELANTIEAGDSRDLALTEEIGRLEESLREIEQALARSDARAQKQSLTTVLEGLKREVSNQRDAVDSILLTVETASTAVASVPQLSTCRESVEGVLGAVRAARAALDTQDLEAVASAVIAALQLVKGLMDPVERAVEATRIRAEEAETKRKETDASARTAERFGMVLETDTSLAIEMLEAAGIKATPVCTLLQVADPAWQSAIEGFLASNREALLVPRGTENDAVTLLLNRQPRLYGALIVQPDHLKHSIGKPAAPGSVASLLRSDNPEALAFARNIFGSMQMVQTVNDLRLNPHSMTKEGGLSRSGGTKTIRLVSPTAFKLGRRFDRHEAEGLRQVLARATEQAAEARRDFEGRVKVRDRVARAQDTRQLTIELQSALDRMKAISDAVHRQESLIAAIDLGELAGQDEEARKLERQIKTNRDIQRDWDRKRGGAVKEREQIRLALQTCESDLKRCRVREHELRADPDYDGQHAEDKRADLEKVKGSEVATLIEEAKRRAGSNRKRFGNVHEEAMDQFRGFIDRNNYGLIDERRDWRLASAFVDAEKAKLEQSELVQREHEANEARQVAEESFRKDVAISIANAIHDMRSIVRELNRTLDACPEFTRSERYRFTYEVRSQYRTIHDYIIATAGETGGDLFGGETEVSRQIVDLLQQAATSGQTKDPNPIDDFRLMFSFDVDITARGAFQARLSSRVGPGSGGEHKTPFYVIAGAALAHAYRLDSKSGKRGAALMILDEAFNKMDPQNSFSAARFLDSLGLQLIMTAPDDSFGKLAPFCDRVYEMTRSGMDVFYEEAQIKDKAKDLLRSDMVQEHPDLLTNEIARISGGVLA